MTERRVLIVDDDPNTREMVSLVLNTGDYVVDTAATGSDALQKIVAQPPDLVILDINLPDMTGFDVLRDLRRTSNLCVLMLTGRSEASDVVAGLDTGADDYLVKPFRSDELSARVRALLRRVPATDQVLSVAAGEVTIEPKTRTVRVRGETVELTPTEYQLLLLMAQSPGQVFDHRTLLANVWGDEYVNDTAYLKVYIWHLRRKLEENPRDPKIVLTDWGVGYRLAP
jgi:two-component system, OmpR family, KDP operon response regulator KdpE